MHQVIALQTKRERVAFYDSFGVDALVLEGAGRIARSLWWLLRKFKPRFSRLDHRKTFQTIPIDSTKILEAVRLSSRDIRMIHDREARFLLLGHSISHKIWGEMANDRYFEFGMNTRFVIDGQHTILGLTVVVVPWMDGWCLVPELRERAAA